MKRLPNYNHQQFQSKSQVLLHLGMNKRSLIINLSIIPKGAFTVQLAFMEMLHKTSCFPEYGEQALIVSSTFKCHINQLNVHYF